MYIVHVHVYVRTMYNMSCTYICMYVRMIRGEHTDLEEELEEEYYDDNEIVLFPYLTLTGHTNNDSL